ncbi:MAG TPA: universal stress protein [Pseudonocardia sp.]|jgi:nucleotide-binding universal stress UspA family protein|nr:universal stress protein [Pseudonocardia sp.]
MGSYAKILVGTDGSSTSLRAVDRAAKVAGDAGAELFIVCAFEPASKDQVKEAADALGSDAYQVVGSAPADAVLRDAGERAKAQGAEKIELKALQGPPVDVLDQVVADTKADLLVVGNVGLNTLTGRILGSVPQSVARRAGVDVLIVHTT